MANRRPGISDKTPSFGMTSSPLQQGSLGAKAVISVVDLAILRHFMEDGRKCFLECPAEPCDAIHIGNHSKHRLAKPFGSVVHCRRIRRYSGRGPECAPHQMDEWRQKQFSIPCGGSRIAQS